MASTQQDLDRLVKATASVTLRVPHHGKTTEFRSLADIIPIRTMIERRLASPTRKRQAVYAPTFDRGYQ